MGGQRHLDGPGRDRGPRPSTHILHTPHFGPHTPLPRAIYNFPVYTVPPAWYFIASRITKEAPVRKWKPKDPCEKCGHIPPHRLKCAQCSTLFAPRPDGGVKFCSDACALWHRVDRRGPDECWPRGGFRARGGYTYVALTGRRSTSAARVSWELANGRSVPPGLVVRHKCDNPPCVNPAHLETGTPAENEADKVLRGRVRPPQPRTSTRPASVRAKEHRAKVIASRAARRGITRAEYRAKLLSGEIPESELAPWGYLAAPVVTS